MKKKTVLILGNSRLVVFGFRGELIRRLIKENYRVVVSFPNGPFGNGDFESKQFGCEFIESKIDRRGTNPFRDLKLLLQYIKLIHKVNPTVVLAYTVKCDIYGGIACRILRKDFYPNITGLGKGLAEGGLIEFITKLLYKLSIKNACCVFFQNNEDQKYFEKNIKYSKGIVLPGSGVNLASHPIIPYPEGSCTVFTFIGRIMQAKGIDQFISAASYLKGKYSDIVEFHVCGYCEENYMAVMKELDKKGIIKYHGLVNDTSPYEAISHCIVLPSFHPEGMSNVLLEGAAAARPLITTRNAGCQETVNDGLTGYLVKEKDSKDLIEKMEAFIKLPYSQKKQMGLKGREKMEKEFDRNLVVDMYIKEIERNAK